MNWFLNFVGDLLIRLSCFIHGHIYKEFTFEDGSLHTICLYCAKEKGGIENE